MRFYKSPYTEDRDYSARGGRASFYRLHLKETCIIRSLSGLAASSKLKKKTRLQKGLTHVDVCGEGLRARVVGGGGGGRIYNQNPF